MAKLKKTMKEQREKKDLNKEEKRVKRFFLKNRKYFRYLGCQCHLKYEAPPPYGI